MPTYAENIQRLKTSSRARLSEAQQNNINRAKWDGQAGIQQAEQLARFSKTLGDTLVDWKKEQIKKDQIKGLRERQKDRTQRSVNLLRKAQLEEQIADAKEQSQEYALLEAELVELKGVLGVEEAERLRQLDPWAQVGYVKEKLREFNETLPDKVAHAMANSEKLIQIQGLEPFSPKSLKDGGITMLPLQEAAVNTITDDIVQAAGINGYSDEMLELSGTYNTIQKAKDNYMGKARKRFNIEASFKTRQKAAKEYLSIQNPTGEDVYKLFLRYSSTVDGKGDVLGNIGGWDEVYKTLQSAAKGDPNYANKIGNMELPDYLRKKLGAQPGTKFRDQWPGRIEGLKSAIKKQRADAVREEKRYLESDNIALGNEFDKLRRTRDISTDELNDFKNRSRYLGGVLDDRIKKYETVSARDERVDTDRIKDVIASNNGYINHDMLNEFHPRAAAPYRKEADRHEAAQAKRYNVDGLIKGALNEAWTNAGITAKEKPVVWEFALTNAKEDYYRKFNQLVKMGYDPDSANKLALGVNMTATESKDLSEKVPGFEGVVAEIQRTKAASKYTQYGEEQLEKLSNAHIRVHEIDVGKKEMIVDKNAYRTKVIGGEYGKARINEIIESMQRHGTWKGIREAEEALNYYEGLALGKRGMWAYGLIDAQLKAAGHPGIWPDRIEQKDESGTVDAMDQAMQPTKFEGSLVSYNNVINDIEEVSNYYLGRGSVWSNAENLATWLT